MRTEHIILALILLWGCNSPESSDSSGNSTDDLPLFQSSFDYQPEPPIEGKLLGIIELGYSGFNSFVVKMDKQDRWSLEKSVYGKSHVGDDSVTFDHVISKIEDFKTDMIQFGVDPNDINLVASSSAIRNQKVIEIANRLRQLNIGLITVNAEKEGQYSLHATVPKDFRENAFMIDIGSGNTKISWVEDNQTRSIETFGSRYFEIGISDQQARIGIKEAIAQVPNKNKYLCFMVGNMPHVLALATNNRNARYTVLEEPDTYEFSNEQEKAGLNLYDALWEESTFSYVFDWESNFSIGVLMNVN